MKDAMQESGCAGPQSSGHLMEHGNSFSSPLRGSGREVRATSNRVSTVRTLLLFVMVCVLGPIAPARAQSFTGSITGTVTDPSGAVLPNAPLTITNMATGVEVRSKTTSAGDYTAPSLLPGQYRVKVEASGFKAAVETNVLVEVGRTTRVDLHAAVGSASSEVEVRGNSVTLDTDSAAVGQVIQEKQIVDLPLENRDFTNLLLLSPGASTTVVNYINGNNTTFISGARSSSIGYQIDGLTNAEPVEQSRAVLLSIDAVQEFRQASGNYSADQGDSAAQVNLVTKSGTNQYHGTVFEFARNDAFDAYSYFDTEPNQPVGRKPELRQNDYGYSFGGPFRIPHLYNGHDKTFFFANFERLSAINGQTVGLSAPNANYTQGILSSFLVNPTTGAHTPEPIIDPSTGQPFAQDANGNYIIPQSRWSRLAKVMLTTPGKYFPTASVDPSLGTNDFFVAKPPTNNVQQTYRVDQRLTSKDQFAGRFTLTNFSGTGAGITSLGNTISQVLTQSWNASETHTFNANIINEFRIGSLDYTTGGHGPNADPTDVAALGLQNIYKLGAYSFPSVDIGGNYFGGPNNSPSLYEEKILDSSDTLTWVKGAHSISAGYGFKLNWNRLPQSYNLLGTYVYNGTYTAGTGVTQPTVGNIWADFLLGISSSGVASLPTPYSSPTQPFSLYVDQKKFSGFISDTWKASPALTVSAGLRYEFQGVPFEEKNHWFWRNLNAGPGGGLCTADQSLISSGIGNGLYQYCGRNTVAPAPKLPFGPRVGFAYRPFNSDKTVIRAGFALVFDQWQLAEFQSGNLYPYNEVANNTGQQFNNLYTALAAGSPVTSSDLGFVAVLNPPSIKNPYVEQYDLSVQRELGRDTKVDVAYVGNVGRHLETRVTPSQPLTVNGSIPDPAHYCNYYPLYNFGTFVGTPGNFTSCGSAGQVIEGLFGADSNYNSLQVSVDRRVRNMALLASYTWSSAMDDASSESGVGLDGVAWAGPQNSHDIAADYSKSSFDVKQRFVLSAVYQLPFGRGQRFLNSSSRAVDLLLGGWQANAIYQLQGGIPFSVLVAQNNALQSVGQRADIVGNPNPAGFSKAISINAAGNKYKPWFDGSAFAYPSAYSFGDSSRNVLRAPGLNNLDASLFKNAQLSERLSFQLRLEAFNAVNHVQFSAPQNYVGSTAGQIGGEFFPGRIVQLGGKLIF